MLQIPFNKPYISGGELDCISEALDSRQLSGDGVFTGKCHLLLEAITGSRKALLTHSCTAALEMAAILCDFQPGDEVIMPSYTFVSTANAFVIHGATPVFVDIRSDTLNMDECLIEAAITEKTRAIVPVHYAGVACEMEKILAIAKKHDLLVIEDAAQAIDASYKGMPLGGLGDLAALSFHQTKNIVCGEGGALLINNEKFIERAEVIRQKGTNRAQFDKKLVDKYTWVDKGSSFLPSELTAAFLYTQLQQHLDIKRRRLAVWRQYYSLLAGGTEKLPFSIPKIPDHCEHNAHLFYLLLDQAGIRDAVISRLIKSGIGAVFHYVPLHSSPAGVSMGRVSGCMERTDSISQRIIRLPLWIGVEEHQEFIANEFLKVMNELETGN